MKRGYTLHPGFSANAIGCGFRGSVGVARVDVTPPVGIRNRNWGAATQDTSNGTHRTLTATAIAFGDDSAKLVIVAVDGSHWRRVDDWEALQSHVLGATGLGSDQLLINLSHTHAGPVLTAAHADLPGGKLAAAYLKSLADAIAAAVNRACATMEPATVDWTQGRSEVAVNRDLIVNGRPLIGFNPDAPADDTVVVGRVARADGTVIATVVNYACHPTTLAWENLKISPDYVGALREVVEDGTGAPCVFLQGASGDLSPRLQYSGETDLADRHGRAIAHAVLAAVETLPPPGQSLAYAGAVESGAPLAVWESVPAAYGEAVDVCVESVELPLQRQVALSELADQWGDIPAQSRDERLRRASDLREGYIGPGDESVAHPYWVGVIGDAGLVAHPGEAFSALQTQLRERRPGRPVLVMNLTNGPGFVYLPDAAAYRNNSYQSWQTVLARGCLEGLINAADRGLGRVLARSEARKEPA